MTSSVVDLVQGVKILDDAMEYDGSLTFAGNAKRWADVIEAAKSETWYEKQPLTEENQMALTDARRKRQKLITDYFNR